MIQRAMSQEQEKPETTESLEPEAVRLQRLLSEAKERHGAITVAMSGGGHRAALYGLGGLLALVDAQVNRQVRQISSVSGGSILNAYVLKNVAFGDLEPGQLDPLAQAFGRRVTTTGTASGREIAGFVGLAGVAAAAAAVGTYRLLDGRAGGVASMVVLLALFGAALLTAGRMLDLALARRWGLKGPIPSPPAGSTTVEHVFCTTDLVEGQPVYFSTACATGLGWRATPTDELGTYVQTRLPLARVVRASAGFPGIPPVRTQVGVDGGSSLMFLADGGLWNNLGSQVRREHRFSDGRPHSLGTDDILSSAPLICLNASAPLKPVSGVLLHIPVAASFMAIIRSMSVLSLNTVAPRATEMRRTIEQLAGGLIETRVRHLDFVSDIAEDPIRVLTTWQSIDRGLNAARDRVSKALLERWHAPDPETGERRRRDRSTGGTGSAREVELGHEAEAWYRKIAHPELRDMEASLEASKRLAGAVSDPEQFSRIMLSRQPLATATNVPGWESGRPAFTTKPERYRTMLGPVDPQDARDIILRGYVNTFLWALVAAPPKPSQPIEAVFPDAEKVHRRVEAIVGMGGAAAPRKRPGRR